jgi:phage-related minor tail protein
MAVGGIVTGPTLALIGEAGPEAVVPLSGTQGRDYSLGLGGGGGMAGGITVNVNVSGGTDARATGEVIGREVRREVLRLLERTALES